MKNSHSAKLTRELGPLKARIEQVRNKCAQLEKEMRQVVEALQEFELERQRYDALKDVCSALEKLDEHHAKELFWSQFPELSDPEAVQERLAGLPVRFQEKVDSELAKKEDLQLRVQLCRRELAQLDESVYEAYLREQERNAELTVTREIPFFRMRAAVMPWSKEAESERYFRRAVLAALLISLLLGGIVPLIDIPQPDRSTELIEVPERIAKLVKQPPVLPEPEPTPPPKEEEPQKTEEKTAEKKEPAPDQKQEQKVAARKKAQNTGVLAFKESFKDLIVDTPVAQIGSQARIRKPTSGLAGSSGARRSLVAMQAGGTSGGINASAVSRRLGTGGGGGSSQQIGGVVFSRVESTVADLDKKDVLAPERGQSSPSRTDEEIQIIFDQYKAALYRIYNRELRKDPTLRGNILLRITIEPTGVVSSCKVESTDLASKELVDKIIARVLNFNFGPKEGAKKITIRYPIDFLPVR